MESTLLDIAPRVCTAIQSQAEGIGGLLGSAKTPHYPGSMLFVSFSECMLHAILTRLQWRCQQIMTRPDYLDGKMNFTKLTHSVSSFSI
jgi:hypothetical protein